jgi:hypothetical protein
VMWSGLAVAFISSAIVALPQVPGVQQKPEVIVRVGFGFIVTVLALEIGELARYRKALVLYCGVTVPCILLMGWIPRAELAWFVPWIAYKVLQLLALSFFLWALVRKEVQGGLRIIEGSDGGGSTRRYHGLIRDGDDFVTQVPEPLQR